MSDNHPTLLRAHLAEIGGYFFWWIRFHLLQPLYRLVPISWPVGPWGPKQWLQKVKPNPPKTVSTNAY